MRRRLFARDDTGLSIRSHAIEPARLIRRRDKGSLRAKNSPAREIGPDRVVQIVFELHLVIFSRNRGPVHLDIVR